METVIVLPVLLMLITGIVQFARIWQARLMVWYAAYNAARAVLVYHPTDYKAGNDFMAQEGVAWAAAVNTLAWVSATPDAADGFWMPTVGILPNSSGIAGQVRIVPEQSWERNGMVRVTVEFQYPTLFKVVDVSSVFQGTRPSAAERDAMGILNAPTITLTETCILPKPWTTLAFPKLDEAEQTLLATPAGMAL
ncbi:MAG: pilus assembly protein [Kiritimatiellaeota bacterium]|nr:pilus assembly protein [Kiritimatiellota bacterium]